MNRLFIRRPSYMAYNIGYGDGHILTGSEGWAEYMWDQSTGVITYRELDSNDQPKGSTFTVQPGTTQHTRIKNTITNWTPVPGTIPGSSTTASGTTSNGTTGSGTSNGDKEEDSWWKKAAGGIIGIFDPIPAYTPPPGTQLSDQGIGMQKPQPLPSWVIPVSILGGVSLIGLIVVATRK